MEFWWGLLVILSNYLSGGHRTQELLAEECERIHQWITDAWRASRILKNKARIGEPLGWSGRPQNAANAQPHLTQGGGKVRPQGLNVSQHQ